jgi:hypothetical protein
MYFCLIIYQLQSKAVRIQIGSRSSLVRATLSILDKDRYSKDIDTIIECPFSLGDFLLLLRMIGTACSQKSACYTDRRSRWLDHEP